MFITNIPKGENMNQFKKLVVVSALTILTTALANAGEFHGEVTLKGKDGEILQESSQKLIIETVSKNKQLRTYSDFEGKYKITCEVSFEFLKNGMREVRESCPNHSLVITKCDGSICDGILTFVNFHPDKKFSVSEFNTADRRIQLGTFKDGAEFNGIDGVFSYRQLFKKVK